jgi:2-polyprenyl-6-methoxyphenol hydroxylase-like FAD-dependent oxidoreductase
MQASRPLRVLICGGGIGGLTAALSLAQAGAEVSIFESAEDVRALGVGINLLPHAVRVLDELGLSAALELAGVRTAELAYYTRHGQLIWSEPRGVDAGYHWPQYSIHRGRLLELLWQAVRDQLGENALSPGHHLASFRDDGQTVQAAFINRRTGAPAGHATGDLLIGADGIHSVVRSAFYPGEGEPKCAGRLLWRAISEAPAYLTGRSMIMAGNADHKFVAYPISPVSPASGLCLVNWIAELNLGEKARLPRRDWNRRGDKSSFAGEFRQWKFPFLDIPRLIDSAAEVFEFPMVDRDPVPRWSFGRVTLLGDAAHPMYPIGSNGASQAILDAEAIAEALRTCSNPIQALERYQEARLEPTAQIVHSNRRLGPEVVMQMVEERAPNGFVNLHDVISHQELESVALTYKRTAGFDRESLNAHTAQTV